MKNKAQALWEITLFLGVLVLIAGAVIWFQMKKPSNSNTFNDQAQQHSLSTTQEIKYYSLLNILPWTWSGCAPKRPILNMEVQ